MEKLIAQIATQIIIKDKNQRILLLRRNKPDGLFTLPGGTIHRGEDIKVGLKRELSEETGLDILIGDPVWIWQSDHIGRDLLGVVFSSPTILKGDEQIKLSKEHSEFGWFSLENLFSQNTIDPYIKRKELKNLFN